LPRGFLQHSLRRGRVSAVCDAAASPRARVSGSIGAMHVGRRLAGAARRPVRLRQARAAVGEANLNL
jgi:hypothetical protein